MSSSSSSSRKADDDDVCDKWQPINEEEELSRYRDASNVNKVSDDLGTDEPIIIDKEEQLMYLYASNVNVSNFVSVKLLGKSNYTIWKKQMLCLLDSQDLRGLVDDDTKYKQLVKSSNIMKRYGSLVQGWIYGSLNEPMLKVLVNIDDKGPRYIWSALEAICDPRPHKAPPGLPGNSSPHYLSDDEPNQQNKEELRYLYASIVVDVSNFVSVSLLTESNYTTWKDQTLRLLDSENLRGFVDGDSPHFTSPKISKQYEDLVYDWILGSLDDVMKKQFAIRCSFYKPGYLWKYIEGLYNPEVEDPDTAADLWRRTHDAFSVTTITEDTTKLVLEVTSPTKTEIPPDIKKLLKAAAEGRWLEAKRILKDNKDAATEKFSATKKLNGIGQTILHIAVMAGRNNFLESLLDFIDNEDKIIKATNDFKDTALHEAAKYNNKRAAQLLVKKCKTLLFCVDSEQTTPLEAAYRHQNLDTFLYLWEAIDDDRQGIPESINSTKQEIRNDIHFGILEETISTKQYGLAKRLVKTFPQVAMHDNRLLMAMARSFPSDLDFGEALICPSLQNFHQRIVNSSCSLFKEREVLYAWADDVLWATRCLKEARMLLQETVFILLVVPVAVLYPLYHLIRLLVLVILYPFFMLYFLMWKVLAIAVIPIKHIEKKRKKYQDAKELVNLICNSIDMLGSFDSAHNHPCYSRPFLEAVSQGAFEVVDEILYRLPNVIYSRWMERNHMFLQLAITNRSEKIYNLIYHLSDGNRLAKINEEYRKEDSTGNNLLHLAGKLAAESILSRTTGAALQLQRELQWFHDVVKLMLPGDLVKKNADMETPQMVFTREHVGLVTEGERWMKTTAEACSITAALIVTIVFAAAITVPGGNDQETGIPLFKKENAFIIFAVCDAISLFSATSALLVFLSILTTRFAEKDFLVSLPRRLIIGLCALFLSTTSMMVAFSAILFLVFCDKRPWMLAPIGGLTCMPIAVVVTLQLPLLVDLFKSTYIPIFGKQKYIASGKFISNHPMWAYEQ